MVNFTPGNIGRNTSSQWDIMMSMGQCLLVQFGQQLPPLLFGLIHISQADDIALTYQMQIIFSQQIYASCGCFFFLFYINETWKDKHTTQKKI